MLSAMTAMRRIDSMSFFSTVAKRSFENRFVCANVFIILCFGVVFFYVSCLRSQALRIAFMVSALPPTTALKSSSRSNGVSS